MNTCIFTGRLTKDPEVRYTQGDKPMCIAHFTIAVDRDFKAKEGQPTADFPRFVAFGKRGEFIEKYARKGIKLELESQFRSGSYKDKDGQTVFTNEFEVVNVHFAESKAAGGNNNSAPASGSAAGETAGQDEFLASLYDDELPFN